MVLVLCGLVAQSGTVGGAERGVFHAVNDLPGWLYRPLWVFQQFGNLFVAVGIGVAVCLLLRRYWVAGAVVLAAVLKLGGEKAVKQVVERARPGTTIGDVHLRGNVSLHGESFVSGHAVLVAAIACLVVPYLRGRWKLVPGSSWRQFW